MPSRKSRPSTGCYRTFSLTKSQISSNQQHIYVSIHLFESFDFFTVFYTCHILADSNWRLTASINTYGNVVDRIFALDVANDIEVPSCSTDSGGPFITTQGNFSTFSIDIDSNTGVPTPACGVQQSPVSIRQYLKTLPEIFCTRGTVHFFPEITEH